VQSNDVASRGSKESIFDAETKSNLVKGIFVLAAFKFDESVAIFLGIEDREAVEGSFVIDVNDVDGRGLGDSGIVFRAHVIGTIGGRDKIACENGNTAVGREHFSRDGIFDHLDLLSLCGVIMPKSGVCVEHVAVHDDVRGALWRNLSEQKTIVIDGVERKSGTCDIDGLSGGSSKRRGIAGEFGKTERSVVKSIKIRRRPLCPISFATVDDGGADKIFDLLSGSMEHLLKIKVSKGANGFGGKSEFNGSFFGLKKDGIEAWGRSTSFIVKQERERTHGFSRIIENEVKARSRLKL
jgi:hypothetical protein